ncbi:MAG: hypothetical protein KDA58_01255 [Planctomycetaceae bacterium]|nr:hypothetical protein [Planctomycetaceae bacterium]
MRNLNNWIVAGLMGLCGWLEPFSVASVGPGSVRADDVQPTVTGEGGVSTSEPKSRPVGIRVSSPGMDSPNAKKIADVLALETHLEFPGNPLADVADFISELHEIPILLDEATLASEGVAPDTEVRTVISQVSLRSALKLVLADVGGVPLDYVIEDEVLKITTRDQADRTYETHIYDVRALQLDDPETLVHVLKHTTSGRWNVNQGDALGDISYVRGNFVIRQTQRVHREIVTLLEGLADHVQQGTGDENWPTPKELPVRPPTPELEPVPPIPNLY